ncbi:hypothetical protein A3D80_04460 [Candidatus Roizmanbacteria bacterium RIFCSPHIGHO2_02_FULL_40_13b]|uniref:Uncharacterized protein n=1 Tax=Candidatus Roizmanbacteria bacterium RIFCSPHIGHO2_01_FULL_39_24 TaxID=1802032 RepID=A0A1F7GFF6_9BACT|nr:MAG: hypothetical protein A2799_04470 [Candidatus Roizmanbacteria bacterium RIFCSPHIGHO2_01_FULL_39_24]OGK26417.1 MAG: hypothetical protein A3D80_04460 [Candidatus Roizmanbacteria bacterium RIFCSPHIGHO2_02_FULL_40_13b]OGK49029.1 MAG: hypothetical protein A3A56_03300 [Candidatus Roizmanbacteria bacterium RIFCSPLOWO2_01_FULL_40_32]OGK57039.1 MAG: hypothetical protein A3H83_00440 [Candidatus Roizmanbacteria bacterium RIFCSPLOWO2_02_FULL_39_8]
MKEGLEPPQWAVEDIPENARPRMGIPEMPPDYHPRLEQAEYPILETVYNLWEFVVKNPLIESTDKATVAHVLTQWIESNPNPNEAALKSSGPFLPIRPNPAYSTIETKGLFDDIEDMLFVNGRFERAVSHLFGYVGRRYPELSIAERHELLIRHLADEQFRLALVMEEMFDEPLNRKLAARKKIYWWNRNGVFESGWSI